MSYNREDIPEMIKLFKSAKKIIRNPGVNYFLCLTVNKIDASAHIKNKAREMIHYSLGGHFTLNSWLKSKTGACPEQTSANRKLRVLWCNKIIRDLRAHAQ